MNRMYCLTRFFFFLYRLRNWPQENCSCFKLTIVGELPPNLVNLLLPRHLYRRRQANENENSWSRYINEETNAKINSSYNYLEVEILSEKKHRQEWQDSLQTVPKKQKLPDPCALSLLAHHCLVCKRLIWITRPHSKHDFTSEPQSYLKGSWWKTWEVWNVKQKCWLKTLRRCNYQRSPEPFKIIFPKKIVYEWHPS